MGYFFLAIWLSLAVTPVWSSDVGVSISIGQPGFYGQINLGNQYPNPRLLYPQPMIAIPPSMPVQQQPIYLYVPPGHAKKWNKYCYRYQACNQPVYFIQQDWYNDVYVPHYHNQNNYPHQQHYDTGHRHYDNDDSHHRVDRRHESRQHDHNGRPQNQRHDHGHGKDKHRDNKHDRGDHDRGKRHD